MLDFLNNIIVASVIKGAIVILALLTAFAYMTLIERRVVAKIQGRLGPNRAGPFGLFQPIADALKMAFKEQIVPSQAKKVIYLIAPVISVVIALCAFAVVPIGNNWIDGKHSVWDPFIGDINVGLLWILSISSLAVKPGIGPQRDLDVGWHTQHGRHCALATQPGHLVHLRAATWLCALLHCWRGRGEPRPV